MPDRYITIGSYLLVTPPSLNNISVPRKKKQMNTTTPTTVTTIIISSSSSFSSLPCMDDSYHVYGISCFLNSLLLLIPRQLWPVQSIQHNVYLSWNISILTMHIYWFYQSGYRVLNENQIFFIVALVFLALTYALYYFQIRFHWIISLLTVAILWTYEASSFMQLIGFSFVVLLAIFIGIMCLNLSWYCARITHIERTVILLEAFVVGTISAFSLRFVIEQQPPSSWQHIGNTQVCCTNSASNADQFSKDCPLSLTWIVVVGSILFTIARLSIGIIIDKIYNMPRKRDKQQEEEKQRIYDSYLDWLDYSKKRYSLLTNQEPSV